LDLFAETIVMFMRPDKWCWNFIIHVLEDYYMLMRCLCMMIFRNEFYENRIMYISRKWRCSI